VPTCSALQLTQAAANDASVNRISWMKWQASDYTSSSVIRVANDAGG